MVGLGKKYLFTAFYPPLKPIVPKFGWMTYWDDIVIAKSAQPRWPTA